jgi:hypothetical protein
MGDYNSLPFSNAMQIIDWVSPDAYRIEIEANRELVFKNQTIVYELCDAEKLALFKFKNAYSCYNEASSPIKPLGGSAQFDLQSGITEDFCIDGYPMFTNYTKGFKGTLDHVMYSDRLSLLELRALPTINEFRKFGILECPNRVFPSDHLPIAAVFEYQDQKSTPILDRI